VVKKLLSSKAATISSAALILGLASFTSRLIGVVRNRIFAHEFGAGEALDIYYAAFKVPDFIYQLIILGALSAGFIPLFLRAYVQKKEYAWYLMNTVLSVFGVLLAAVSVLLFFTMPFLVPFIVPGFSEAAIAETVYLSRIMLLSPLILGVSGILGSALQALKHFLVYSLSPILYNLGIIIGAIFLVPHFGLKGLAFGVLIGAVLHVSILIPTVLHQGFSFKFQFKPKSKQFLELVKLMIPRSVAIATYQINFIIMTVFASTLAAGSITVFSFANDLQYFAVGIVGVSFAIAAFPTLSEHAAKQNGKAFIEHLVATIRKVTIFIIPIMICLLMLRAQIVRVVLGSGQFDWAATIATADALAMFSLSLFAQAMIPVLARAFYALHDTYTPLFIAIIGTLTNIVAAFLLKDILGISGLALAFSIGATIQFVLLWVALRHQTSTLNESVLLQLLYKISFATILMTVTIQSLKNWLGSEGMFDLTRFWGIFLQGLIAGIAGLIVYAGMMYLMKVPEIKELFAALSKKRRQAASSGKPPEPIVEVPSTTS
jgi:putative peptidoglycan lipid II flippase